MTSKQILQYPTFKFFTVRYIYIIITKCFSNLSLLQLWISEHEKISNWLQKLLKSDWFSFEFIPCTLHGINNLLRLGICNDNLCEKCSGIFVENEYHYLFRYSAYTEYRVIHIPERYRLDPSIKKLNELLQTNDTHLICSIIKFIIQSKIVSI